VVDATIEPPLALTNGDVILIVVFVAIPVAAIAFALGAGNALRQIGKGQLSVEYDRDLGSQLTDSDAGGSSPAAREDEIRQMLEAKAYRQSARGETPLDVDSELERLTAEEAEAPAIGDASLRDEVRQLVIARNERRERQGKEPLDVEAEIERQLRELEGLGQ
jgi:hypothetical protein